jgi:RNA polymerase sigma-70 factor, ECF subfamily
MLSAAQDDNAVTAAALAAAAGDRAAAAAFVRATQHHVYRFLAHLTDRSEAEDLVQETYLRAMRALPGFAGRSSARTWLLAIARRVAADHIRALTTRPRADRPLDAVPPAEMSAGPGFEDGVLLRQLLAALPADRREAFVATQVVGLSYAETAEICGCPVGTIRSRVARAREDLAAALTVPAPSARAVPSRRAALP